MRWTQGAMPGPGMMPASRNGGLLITGIAPTHFILGSVDTVVPHDAAEPIRAYSLSGETFIEAQVSATEDGGFSFTVPSLPYLVGVGNRWLLTEARRVDLGVNQLGRADKGPAPTTPTDVMLTANGLTAWDNVGDTFQLASESVGEQGTLSGALASGAASCSNSPFTYSSRLAKPAGLDAARGDTAVISQLRRMELPTDGGTLSRCSGIIASGESGAGLLPRAQRGPGGEPRAAATQDRVFRLAALGLARPRGRRPPRRPDERRLRLGRGRPGRARPRLHRVPGRVPVQCELAGQPAGPVQVQYGNPKSSWAELGENLAVYVIPVQLPAPATRGSVFAFAWSSGPTLLSGPLVPVMSPPRDLAVDTQPAQGAHWTVATTTPVVSWRAPSLGSPTHYRVTVMELYMATSGQPHALAHRRHRRRSCGHAAGAIASGVFVPGTSYSVRVGAAEAFRGSAFFASVVTLVRRPSTARRRGADVAIPGGTRRRRRRGGAGRGAVSMRVHSSSAGLTTAQGHDMLDLRWLLLMLVLAACGGSPASLDAGDPDAGGPLDAGGGARRVGSVSLSVSDSTGPDGGPGSAHVRERLLHGGSLSVSRARW